MATITDNRWPISQIHSLAPEIHDLIASHLPIQIRPAVLLSFALTNSRLCHMLLPVLYSKVIIKTEEAMHTVLQRVIEDKENQVGLFVRELYILIDINSIATSEDLGREPVLFRFHRIIKAEHLPYMHTLGITFCVASSLGFTKSYNKLEIERKCLSNLFWEDLKNNCPQIRALFLHGITNVEGNSLIENSGLNKSNTQSRLGTLSIKFAPPFPAKECAVRILGCLGIISSTLTTLSFHAATHDMHLYTKPILLLTFPHLKSLELGWFFLSELDSDNSMNFWKRHPGLERLFLGGKCFTNDMDINPGLFPNLSHLKVSDYSDARAMASILPQLEFLSINSSVNGQIPYLLRSVLPNGLPKLKSLDITQIQDHTYNVRELEGAMWYETENGEFRQDTRIRRASRPMTDHCYIHSITRGAPNIEELCLRGFPLAPGHLTVLAPTLAQLWNLKRLYYSAYRRRGSQWDLNLFATSCRRLAELCPLLDSVTDLSTDIPYAKINVVRNHTDGIEEVFSVVSGFGMYFLGGDDDPFPL